MGEDSDVAGSAPLVDSSPGGAANVGQRTTPVPWRRMRLLSSPELAGRAATADADGSDSDFVDGLPFTMSLD